MSSVPLGPDPRLHPPPGGALRPTWRFMLSHPAHAIALGFGSGLAPVAPGTVGTLWAWLVYLLVAPALGDTGVGLLIAATLLVGWWASTLTARHLRNADPSAIVVDEIVAFWIVLWLVLPASWLAQAAAFLVFRVFDAVKPGPVAWADRLFKVRQATGPVSAVQGFGILFDDLVAALCTLLVVAIARFFA